MDPELCADMGLPFGQKRPDTVVVTPETELVDPSQVTIQEGYELVTEVMPDESYLSVLRAQPILLIGLSEENLSKTSLIVLGISILPIVYGFGELAF
jgi:hypothetical protein